MANPVTYADLDELLVGKGFVRRTLSDQHVAYLDRTEEPIFVFPAEPMDQTVQPVHLAAVRRWLLERGLSNEEDIEHWLSQIRFGEPRPEPATAGARDVRAVGGD